MKPIVFRRASHVAQVNHKGLGPAVIDAALLDTEFDADPYKIDPAELRASLDAGRNRRPSAE